jgi:hypothetical protein
MTRSEIPIGVWLSKKRVYLEKVLFRLSKVRIIALNSKDMLREPLLRMRSAYLWIFPFRSSLRPRESGYPFNRLSKIPHLTCREK